MEEDSLDPQDVERAKRFWAKEDVDRVFTGAFECLDDLKCVLKNKEATDKQYVQGLKLLDLLGSCRPASPPDASVVQVVIGLGPGEVLLPDSHSSSSSSSSSSTDGPSSPAAPPARPLTPVQLQYHLHTCCKTCLSGLPSMHRFTPPFWGQNPLKIPLLCGFKRLTAMPLVASRQDGLCEGAAPADSGGVEDWDILYKAPCGQSLRSYDDVTRFLLTTDCHDILQVDFFTFNPGVRLDPPAAAGPKWPELDLSRGTEATPVQLCPGDGGARPPEFRYRKDRWPHGCFLSRGPALFRTCCDCADGCGDKRCACVAMTTGGRHYSHHRLAAPVPAGVYECGPWCGCDWARCRNRLVQRGIRVRLQVYETDGRGWGVRCRDDVDRGTFVCIYAGVILQKVQGSAAPPAPKARRTDLPPSDDDVEVITEWLAPQAQEGRGNPLEATAPPSHVPVIQRSADATAPKRRDETALTGGPGEPPPSAGGSCDQEREPAEGGAETESDGQKSLKRATRVEGVVFVDASKEGNVSRFINHSCQPNLFTQNVFIDSHDSAFPVVAFFTNRATKAGAELTWNYSADTRRKQEVACHCGGDGCLGQFTVEDLCGV
ncbi:histone-lysine N-methyltransferase SETDB2 [Brachionichthys hirsutus]|uniref:histone-lysine N-methyltransferase SETDB2 n=1 Tax=Brachionichthys hirsutus TaxID=412623 RepID=UPI00360439B1